MLKTITINGAYFGDIRIEGEWAVLVLDDGDWEFSFEGEADLLNAVADAEGVAVSDLVVTEEDDR